MSLKLLSLLREFATYDELLGGFTVIKRTHHLRKSVGSKLGYVTSKGYLYARLGGGTYPVHHLVWLWHNGYLPTQLDHIDRDKLNNKIDNLREASNTLNQLNKTVQSNNTLGIENIRMLPSGKYQVRLYARTVGTFGTLANAIYVRDMAKSRKINKLLEAWMSGLTPQ